MHPLTPQTTQHFNFNGNTHRYKHLHDHPLALTHTKILPKFQHFINIWERDVLELHQSWDFNCPHALATVGSTCGSLSTLSFSRYLLFIGTRKLSWMFISPSQLPLALHASSPWSLVPTISTILLSSEPPCHWCPTFPHPLQPLKPRQPLSPMTSTSFWANDASLSTHQGTP